MFAVYHDERLAWEIEDGNKLHSIADDGKYGTGNVIVHCRLDGCIKLMMKATKDGGMTLVLT